MCAPSLELDSVSLCSQSDKINRNHLDKRQWAVNMMGSPGSRASLAWVGSINKQAFTEIFRQKYDRNKFPAEAVLLFRQYTFLFENWNLYLYQYQISDILLDRNEELLHSSFSKCVCSFRPKGRRCSIVFQFPILFAVCPQALLLIVSFISIEV